jgi:hypothetical protein
MPRCQSCGFRLPEDRDGVGARCPHCRSPLYQPPERIPYEAAEGEPACTVHPGNASVGTCGRCGNFLCDTCRTRWGDLVLCAACVDRALRAGDTLPGRQRQHYRHALFGLMGGVTAWVVTGGLIGLGFLLHETGGPEATVFLVPLVLLMMGAAVLVALGGLSFSAAALRTGGDSMILATLGLLLSGIHFGAMIGAMLFGIWLH